MLRTGYCRRLKAGRTVPWMKHTQFLYIDAIHYSVRDNGVIQKLAAYVILSINPEGRKEVLSISAGDNENFKYWLSLLNELKNRPFAHHYHRRYVFIDFSS